MDLLRIEQSVDLDSKSGIRTPASALCVWPARDWLRPGTGCETAGACARGVYGSEAQGKCLDGGLIRMQRGGG